ncbi:unnamed protein product [Bursaphelenchus xylophilus]|uniref:(pine wood nematode) hypothetical protein n=1 Tax=Bursaphelenchus xylophilus TaxID=6326 RepID=A0A1I7RUG5_BURXY|nr:unnamed protein product [Bursaphelenchus xylophilus]CAG9114110.1 unnamed protein product [Bursaphelenchus xylophilus]
MGVLLNEDDLPSEELLKTYRLYKNVTLSVTTAIALVTITVMVSSTTRSMSKYRWYLVHSLVWSLFSDFMGTLIGPVLLSPLPCFFSVNLPPIADSQKIALFFVGCTAMFGKNLSVMFQLEHRFVKSQSVNSRYHQWFGYSSMRMELVIRGAILAAIILSIEIPIVIFMPPQVKQRQAFASLDPVAEKVFESHVDTLCISSSPNISRTLLPTCFLMTGIVVIFVLMLTHMHVSIRKNHGNANTYRMQMMLFWSLVAQMTAMFIFIQLPAIILIWGTFLGVRNLPKIAIYCFSMFFLHTSFDCLLILYFIKPYREFLWKYLHAKRLAPFRDSLSISATPKISVVKYSRH